LILNYQSFVIPNIKHLEMRPPSSLLSHHQYRAQKMYTLHQPLLYLSPYDRRTPARTSTGKKPTRDGSSG
jgi:hypothetical protein